MDTIFALASARGKAGVAVIRVSGPDAFSAGEVLAGALPPARTTGLRTLRNGNDPIDEALVLSFSEGASFTGEPVVEFHLHGSTAVVSSVLSTLSSVPGLRMAEPGEFTRRAMENERLDLAQVEGLADLIDSETEAQRKQALRVLSGALGDKTSQWRKDLVRATALLEATIDFADEEVPVDVSPEVLDLVDRTLAGVRTETAGARISERIRDGFEVAIVGAPNAGKSTLLNALAGRDAAITSEVAGTTRDVLEVRMDLAGLPVTILDTAGLRESEDVIERLGIERAKARAADADLRIFLLSGEVLPMDPMDGDIVVQGKSDLTGTGISGKTGEGLDFLVEQITSVLSERASHAGTAIRERHRVALSMAQVALENARIEVQSGSERSELAAEELWSAIRALDALMGRVDVEVVLDEIFASFCLGK
ncbi:tRNA modification GTPase trmE [Maritimibacter alkaliphilus HTCC2654]|uniref:tRNA modification GTPase MnmE n=1 Tax=Maritimibacter alkaliphilus HTCC2654 TaxID=314271 RepID=A3VCC3_9RHOB|nr:tRNA uridine-5-carboxymethylaminomethyl(34) synthesis GTPase MnmE [Maritimibacter alkaliphilus]EAQ14095.1 tRNA modification GTPase [Maritimibacter alkaliphilus HTCC2654]TYP84287.1 tRNA modification GTPase trmE [Maritimibacter alkaliphilus HTCC2654]